MSLSSCVLRFLLPLFLLILAALAGATTASSQAASSDGRLIVLGFDGADGRTVKEMMESGQLPNLARLRDRGTFAPLGTTNPAESPVSWASLHTGQNPGKTGIPGFVMRQQTSTGPMPTMGHIETGVTRKLEDLANPPIPAWNANKMAAIAGGAAFLAFLLLFAGLLRMGFAVSFVLALLLGGAGAYAGWKMRGYLPVEVEVVANRLQATPFWETAAEAGVQSVVLAAAQSFDRKPVDGAKVLAGLGVPDAAGDVQSFFVFTTDELWFHRDPDDRKTSTGSGGVKLRVDDNQGVIESRLHGPKNFWRIGLAKEQVAELDKQLNDPNLGYKDSIALQDRKAALDDELKALQSETSGRLHVPVRVEKHGATAAVTIGAETRELAEGEWSDWFQVVFELNPLIKVHAVTRAKIIHMDEPHFELYVDTLQIDPASPPFWQPISMPPEFASELASELGTYETIGWACATMPLKDEVLDPISFMQEIQFTFETRKRMTLAALERDDWRILMSTLSTPDRVQHMMYQYYDEEHPSYDPVQAGKTFEFFGETIALKDCIPGIYRQVDALIGEVLDKHVGERDTLLICADHGFQSFRRQCHVNNWLHDHGYLALKDGVKGSQQLLSSYVDWERTKAYSLGLGMIYLNKVGGPTPKGIVKPEEERDLLARIRADFIASKDPETGIGIGRDAYILADEHPGPFQSDESDLMLGFHNGYRSSWSSASGGFKMSKNDAGETVPGPTYENNAGKGSRNWSGDHTSMAADIVAGIFFSNRKVSLPAGGIDLLHIAPTALAVVGVEVPAVYDREPLEFLD